MRAELLRGIADHFDDDAHWLAYADWLQQEDAPRGELIALDLALETASDEIRDGLQARRSELIAARASALLGETFSKFVAERYGTIAWRRGFVDRLAYNGKGLNHLRAVGWLVNVICDEHPEPFTFLRALELPSTDLASLEPIARFTHLVELDIANTAVTDLAPLAAFPKLRALDIRGTPLVKPALEALRERGVAIRV